MGLFTAVAADATRPEPFVLAYLFAAACALGCTAVSRWLGSPVGFPADVAVAGAAPVLPDQPVPTPTAPA